MAKNIIETSMALLLSVVPLIADDIVIPLGRGNLVIRDAQFIKPSKYADISVPELSFKALNQTGSPWNAIKLQFDMSGLCGAERRQWQRVIGLSLGWMADGEFTREIVEPIIPLTGKVNGCITTTIVCRLISAENTTSHVDGSSTKGPTYKPRLAESFALKDRHGLALAKISEVAMFRYSGMIEQVIPEFRATLLIASTNPLELPIVGIVHKKDGTKLEFYAGRVYRELNMLRPCPCLFEPNQDYEIGYSFPPPWFSEEDFASMEFALPPSWQSPEDKRLATEALAKAEAAEAARRKRIAAEAKRKRAEEEARVARMKAVEAAKAAEERRRVRDACRIIYQTTADKRIADLTVRQEQQVRACQTLGMYPPRWPGAN